MPASFRRRTLWGGPVISLLMMLVLPAPALAADCNVSSYAGKASLNEFFKDKTNQANDSDDFVEVKILDDSITSATFDNWQIRLCEDNEPGNNNDDDGCSGAVSLASFTEKSKPWIVLRDDDIGHYFNFKTGFDAVLLDASGDIIDYLSVDGYGEVENRLGCTVPTSQLPFDNDSGAPGASDKFIYRTPDGTGDWDSAESASEDPTEDDTNDQDPDGDPAPEIAVDNVTVVKGQSAVFTLTLPDGAESFDITVDYTTQDDTAVAGTDYIATSGTASIPAGSTSTTISVDTIAGSASGEVEFVVYLSNPVNATITNHYPRATILADALAAWTMDENSWDGSSGEVTDASGNGYDGTSQNGPSTQNTSPAISGSPGTCGYGQFDGSDDYIALPGFPDLTGSFTITAWINADAINADQRIFADDENNSGGFAFSLGDGGDGRLRFFSRDISPISLDSSAAISAGTWYHVAAVHDANAKTRQIFVNGSAVTGAQGYTGTWGTDSGTASIGGETDGAGSEAVANWRFDGLIDEVRVFGSALDASNITTVMNRTRNCPTQIDHIEIEHDGTALTCEPEDITIRACQNSDCSTLYTGSVTVDLSPSGWVGGDTQTFSGGSANLRLRHTSPGVVTLDATSTSPSSANSTVCQHTAAGTNSCELEFFDSGFDYSVPTQTSCATSASISVRAVRKDDTSQQCVPSFQNRNETVNFWSSYSDPSSGTNVVTLNNGSNDYALATSSPGTGVPLSFDSNGEATITLTYPDAGQLALNSSFTGSGDEAGLVMTGSDDFVVKPAKLYVFSDDANAGCAGASPGCSAFRRAGESFNLKVRAACADNSVTPNFQLSGMTLSHSNVAPAIAPGTLNVGSFDMAAGDNGEHTITTQSVSEVGAFTFTAGLPAGGYFGESIGNTGLNTSDVIGRFYPDHFCLVSTSLVDRTEGAPFTAASCSDGFTYLDEDFSAQVTLKAQARGISCSDSSVTHNYDGAWSKFSSPFSEDHTDANEAGKWNLGAVDDPAGGATVLNSRIDPVANAGDGDFANGQLTFTLQQDIDRLGSAPDYTAETPLADVRLGINPIDTDNVALDTTDLTIGGDNYRQVGSTALYFGRLFAENAFGTNDGSIPLRMYARSEYCNSLSAGVCDEWLHKSDDSCSLLSVNPPADTDLGHLSDGDGGGYYQRPSPAVSSDNYDFSAASGRIHVPDSSDHSGGWQLFYTAGGDGGDYLIPFDAHGYLRTEPGTASFGLYRGDDRVIYWREVFD